jgi:hypothetical protein
MSLLQTKDLPEAKTALMPHPPAATIRRHIDPFLTEADKLVLSVLLHDGRDPGKRYAAAVDNDVKEDSVHEESKEDSVYEESKEEPPDVLTSTLETLENFNNSTSISFSPTVFTTWDAAHLNPIFAKYVATPFTRLATPMMRNPLDVVFLTHLLLYFCTSLPSAILLYQHFTWWHSVLHCLVTVWYAGPFTLLLHNHIHNNGVLARHLWLLDGGFPYLIGPLMGHTWNSYFYHHVKHHHAEGNGPEDLSSTLRYQRDEWSEFARYVGRFLFLVWAELPLYFLRKKRYELAVKCVCWELGSYGFITTMAYYNPYPTLFVFILPLLIMRLAMMIGNWGQHALVDADDPESDFRSSVTLIDVPVCFTSSSHIYFYRHFLVGCLTILANILTE